MSRSSLAVLLFVMAMSISVPQASVAYGAGFASPAPSAKGSSARSGEWWNLDWRYRMRMTAVNPTDVYRGNEILLVHMEIPYGRCLSGFRELRVVDEAGVEVPSTVIYEYFEDGFTRGAFLAFFANFSALETRSFYVYYGNPTVAPPSYRARRPVSFLDNEILKIDFSGDMVDLWYRMEPYSHQFASKVRYNGSERHDYGPVDIGQNRLTHVAGWASLLNATGTQVNATSSICKAGSLTLVKFLLIESNRLWIFDTLINEDPNLVDDIVYIDLFDAVSMSARGFMSGGFNLDDRVLFAEVGGTFVGLKSDLNPDAYDVGFWRTVYNQTRDVRLSMASVGYGNLALALQWNLGALKRHEHKILTRFFTVGATYAELRASLNDMAMRPQVEFSREEVSESPIPLAAVMAIDEVQMVNLTVPLKGFTTFSNASEAGWAVNSAWIRGDVVYRLPGKGDYDFEWPTLWTASQHAGPNCIAFSTAHTWSEGRESYVGAVRLWDNSSNDHALGIVNSPFIRVIKASKVFFGFQYKAKYDSYNGSLPKLYVALVVDVDFDEVSDGNLTLPLRETSVGLNDTKVSELIGDARWRSIKVDVTNFIAAKDFQFSIEVHGETYGFDGSGGAFRGLLEIDVDDIFVEVHGSCQDVFDVKVDPFSYNATVSYGYPGFNTGFSFSVADASLYYLVVKSMPRVSFEPGGIVKTAFPYEGRSLVLAEHAAVMYGVQESFIRDVYLNETLLGKDRYVFKESCLIISREPFLSVFGTDRLTTFELQLSNVYHALRVHVKDENGKPLSNASVVADDNFGRRIIEGMTDSAGAATLDLIPHTYVVNVVYHGIKLDSKSVELKGDSELTFTPLVYELRFKVFDTPGRLVEGAEVQLMRDGVVVGRGLTDGEGSVTFRLVAGSTYVIRVFVEGQLSLEREFKVTVNNIVVDLRTSFTPMWFVAAIIASLVAVAVMVLLLKKRFA